MSSKLDCKIIEPNTSATHCVIWLHGLGASSDDFMPVVPQLNLAENLAVRFIFPQAPSQSVTLNMGMTMPAWYDLYGLDLDSEQDETGIRQTEGMIVELINQQINNGIASENIVLAGFSQGGAIALHTALRFQQKLAGIMALSTYLPIADFLGEERSTANANIPIFLARGEDDGVLPLIAAEMSQEYLQAHQYPVEFKRYPMAHEVCLAELRDISDWLNKVLS